MNKAEFLQEKAAFLIRYPNRSEADFYRHLTEQFPDEPAGWLYLGREREQQGDWEDSLRYYRQALRTQTDSPFRDEAQEAYRRLRLRQLGRDTGRQLLSLAALLLLLTVLAPPIWAPVQLAPVQSADPNHVYSPVAPSSELSDKPVQHTEVLAVPPGLTGPQLQAQLKQYLERRGAHYAIPYTVLLVPEKPGLPSFTPLLFYQPGEVKGVVRYDPTQNKLLEETYFDTACQCTDQPAVARARRALLAEQQALERVLLLRNALYRFYQQTGRLPEELSALARPAPANWLSALPPVVVPSFLQQPESQWRYYPERFRPEMAWDSLTEVLPLPYYPEPLQPLEPLQIIVHKPSYRLLLVSGPHLVRQYPVAIGKNNATPEGYFTILQKINQPEGKGNVYGTRGMTFANASYAIHGTNAPDSIGQAVSLGCIRLYNADVEELYSFVTPGTEVIVTAQALPPLTWTNGERLLLPASSQEMTPGVQYQWLH